MTPKFITPDFRLQAVAEGMQETNVPILSVRDLSISFETDYGSMLAVDGVSFDLDAGEIIGIVGESGSGKSVVSQTILQLVPSPPSYVEQGQILFNGEDLLTSTPARMREIRGNDISVIFQEPMTSLNPLLKIGTQVMEPMLLHQGLPKKQAEAQARELLARVGFPHPEHIMREYPHRLSGGMRQRVMIAMALACRPKVLIADEPTTALDVTIQAQIFDLLESLRREMNMAVILITHDLGVVADMADKVMVMYSGRTMESGPAASLLSVPLHPYTKGLMRCIPPIDEDVAHLSTIEGTVPNAYRMPPGCPFHPRCPDAFETCARIRPELREAGPGHRLACHLTEGNNSEGEGNV